MRPAKGDGTSIVALSDSSVSSNCSTATSSPGFTSASITGTSAKSPISGMRISMMFAIMSSQRRAAEIGQGGRDMAKEAGGGHAVHHAVIPGQADRQHKPGLEGRAVPYSLHGRAAGPQNRHFRRVDDGREACPPTPPSEETEKQPPCMSVAASEPARALSANKCISAAISIRPLRSQSRMTGTISPFGVSAAKPIWT
ncbi:hypothetical protein C7441_105292 [Pseudaminobacter salicylatoxidans]|uniref:Uncharacterized protein n=1 Tax=Pseudaminobacter salicylatoxidans TaxID=93369 RepID=A0A316C4H8_PSESE|nr:hypothetical protein C7441_105292 [Pseudaminobacter salicylatoxidans]